MKMEFLEKRCGVA